MAQRQTGSDGLIVMPGQGEGLSLQQLEDMLSDIRFQPLWREEAAKCADYYDGHQLTQDRLDRMDRLGIPPLITNLIAPAINAVLGMEAKTRTDWRVTQENEVQDVPEDMLDAMNAKLNEAERESRADRAISDAYAPQVKAGLGWVEVGRSTDALAYPYRVSAVHRDEIWWDWRARQPDLYDGRYLIRKRVFDQDVLMTMMPEHKDLIRWSIEDKFRTWQWDTKQNINTDLAYAAHLERITNIDSLEWRNADRRRATLYEAWYRVWQVGEVFRVPGGRTVIFNKKNPRHLEAVRAGVVHLEKKPYSHVRVAFYMGCHRLYDMPSPYAHRHFPYVPFWGYREDTSGVPYGLIRSMISPQDVVNSSDSKMHWMLNSRRLRADSDALDQKHNTWSNVRENLARADSIVLLDPSKPNARFKEENDNELNAQQFQRRMQAAANVEQAGGIYRAMLGNDSNATSGIAISSLVEQGNITLAEINDNYQYARRQVGELLFSLVREDMMTDEVPVAVKKEGKRRVIVLNQRLPDGGIDNEVAAVPSKVVLEDVPSTPAFRQQQLQMLSQYTKGLPPQIQLALADIVIGLTDVPQKDKVMSRIKKIAGIQDDLSPEEEEVMQQAAEQARVAQQEAMMKRENAQTALLEAKVTQLESMVAKGESERLVKMVEAMYAAMQAAQIVASVPGVAPVADEILKGAGYQPQSGGQDPNIPDVVQNQQPASPMMPGGQVMPDAPAQEAGMMRGIETPGNDGVIPA